MARIIVNSVPKSGTHLIEKALHLLGASRQPPLFISSAVAAQFAPVDGEAVCPIGVGHSVPASLAKLRASLQQLPEDQVITGHLPFSDTLRDLLESLDYRMILAIRDPRDVAVSLAFHIAREPGHRLHEPFRKLTPSEQLMCAISGCDGLEDVGRRFQCVMEWTAWSGCLLVRFEDIIGEKGGGDAAAQRCAIERIISHLQLRDANTESAIANLFGQSPTFRKGAIGQWRDHFTRDHHLAFAAVERDLLRRLGYQAS